MEELVEQAKQESELNEMQVKFEIEKFIKNYKTNFNSLTSTLKGLLLTSAILMITFFWYILELQ
jgi:hypothetical protein